MAILRVHDFPVLVRVEFYSPNDLEVDEILSFKTIKVRDKSLADSV
jgi:hypothetical protein